MTEQNMETLTDEQLETLTQPGTTEQASPIKGEKKDKPKKFSLPFTALIFSKPDRDVKVERRNKKGEKTGVVGRLVAEVALPLPGNILTIKTGVWCDTRFDRDAGGFVDTYSLSLSRNTFDISADGRKHFDAWRESILCDGGLLDKWLESPEAKQAIARQSSTPRLVKVRKVENADTMQVPAEYRAESK